MSNNIATAIENTLGPGGDYGGNITEAVAELATDLALAVSGFDDSGYRIPNKEANLCKSLDGISESIRELADAIRSLKS
jgi:hypothetical protein